VRASALVWPVGGGTFAAQMVHVTDAHRAVVVCAVRGIFSHAVPDAAVEDAVHAAVESMFRLSGDRAVRCLRSLWVSCAANALRSGLRAAVERRSVSLDALMESTMDHPGAQFGHVDTPLARLMRSEFREDVGAWLLELTPTLRHTLIRHDVQGFDFDEIAHETGRSRNAIKMQVCRARAQMRDWLDDYATDILTTDVGVRTHTHDAHQRGAE